MILGIFDWITTGPLQVVGGVKEFVQQIFGAITGFFNTIYEILLNIYNTFDEMVDILTITNQEVRQLIMELPDYLIVIATASVLVSIIYLILGRN